MSDGNIIIAAVDTTDDDRPTYMLKCHRSMLSRNSEVFRDLFELPQPSVAEEYDGLPVVALTDSYKDIKGVLQMLYDFRYVDQHNNP